MTSNNEDKEPQIRWMETPKGRAIINAVSLTALLILTQQLGYIVPGPPVTFENFVLYAGYGLAVGLLMYVWTDFRIKRQRRKREALEKINQEAQHSNQEDR
jgi:hypothetical protein